MEYYSAIKRNTFESVVVKWINLESVKPRVKEVRKRKKYPILMHICEIWKNGTDEPLCRKDTDIKNGLVDTAGEGEGRSN